MTHESEDQAAVLRRFQSAATDFMKAALRHTRQTDPGLYAECQSAITESRAQLELVVTFGEPPTAALRLTGIDQADEYQAVEICRLQASTFGRAN